MKECELCSDEHNRRSPYCSTACKQADWRRRQKGSQALIKPGTVYLLHLKGFPYYKIGVTRGKAEERMVGLQTGMPFEIEVIKQVEVTDILGAEQYLHKLYDNQRVCKPRGEWFIFDDKILIEVKAKYDHLRLFYKIRSA